MDLKWITVTLLFSAVCGVSAYVPHQYHFVSESMSWTEAQSYCRHYYTDLATINNMEEMMKLNTTLKDQPSQFAWIGLVRWDIGKWQWSLDVGDFNRYQSWNSGEPNSAGQNEYCVRMNDDIKIWYGDECGKQLGFVCYDERKTTSEKYVLITAKNSWRDAQSYCRKNHTDLASVRNRAEKGKIKKVIQGNTVWIGFFRDSRQGSDERDSSFQNWAKNQPDNFNGNEGCVEILTDNGQWNDRNCEKASPFICYDGANASLRLVHDKMTWRDAQSYCRENYTDLTSVRNQTENQQIWDLAKTSGSGDVWIGLFNDSWQWSDQSNSSFRYWASSQPDNQGGDENCAASSMTDQGHWYHVNCINSLPFICHQNQLVLVNQSLSWREALRYCRVNHVDLVSVQPEEIQPWVMEVAQKASTEHVWLGLRHTCALSLWYWVSGVSICSQNWAPGNGTEGEDCRSVERTGAVQSGGEQQWVSLPENQELNFICTIY